MESNARAPDLLGILEDAAVCTPFRTVIAQQMQSMKLTRAEFAHTARGQFDLEASGDKRTERL